MNSAIIPTPCEPVQAKMYEGRSPTIRHHMAGNPLITTVQYVAGTKPSFCLSEIIPYLEAPATVEEIYRAVAPELSRLGLVAAKHGNDVEISRFQPAPAYRLSAAEALGEETFLERRQVPPVLTEAIERYITKKTGKSWDDPAILERLRKAITVQKDDYWKPSQRRSLQYAKGYSVLGYLAYHFPVYFMQTEHLLARLARDGFLKKSMTILDVGTGPGVVPLAIADFWSRLEGATASVYSIERSEEHIEAFLFLRDACVPRGGKVSVKPPVKADIRDPLPSSIPEKIDLLIFSNVLNELPDTPAESRADLVERIAARLAPDGAVLIVEPADEENATRMRTLVTGLHGRKLYLHAPCTFIWGTPCPAPRCWSFATAPAIHQTRVMETLAACEEYYRYINTDIKYSYAVLRPAGIRNEGYRIPRGSKVFRFSKLHLHIGRRVNVTAVKMSAELGDGKNHLFKICDGTAKVPVYAVLPAFHRTPENEVLISAPYGAVLEMEGVLIRYNQDHDAYNLLVNRNTVIRPVR